MGLIATRARAPEPHPTSVSPRFCLRECQGGRAVVSPIDRVLKAVVSRPSLPIAVPV